MRRYRLLAAVVVLGCSAWGVTYAQEVESDAGEVAVRQPANLSDAEKLASAQAVVARATRLSSRVANLLEEARRAADMIRITCLNDKLTQVNANLRNAEGRLQSLSNAVDPGLKDHEYTVITVLGQKFTTLDQEASQCVGQEVYETGSSTNSTKVDANQAGEDEDASDLDQPPPAVSVGAIPPPRSPVM